jgi:hypothetical protein
MAKAALNGARTNPGGYSDGGQEPAPEGMSLFGISLSRILKVPLQRWKLSLLLLAVCAGLAYANAKYNSTISYKFLGKLYHSQPAPKEGIPSPKTWETVTEGLKTLSYYEALNKKFDMGIPPAMFVSMFDIKKGPEDSKEIHVGFEWENNKQGADMVNYLLETHCKTVETARKVDLDDAKRSTFKRMEEAKKELDKARQAAQAILDAKKKDVNVGNDPQKRLDELHRRIEDADKELRKINIEYRFNQRAIDRLKLEIGKTESEVKRLKAGGQVVRPKDDVPDLEFEKQDNDLKKALFEVQTSLRRNERELGEAEAAYKANKELADKNIVTAPVWNGIVTRRDNARDAVKADEKRVEAIELERRKLRPGLARLNSLLAEMKNNLLKQQQAQDKEHENVAAAKDVLKKLEAEETAIASIQQAWEPEAQKVKTMQKEHERLLAKMAYLDDLYTDAAKELSIIDKARESVAPLSNA